MTGVVAVAGETVHATAIVVGQTGILFVGPSGAGKSTAAFACLSEAMALGWNAALIADDRTRLAIEANRCIASCPEPIRGLLELRGTGIISFRRIDRAVIHGAVILAEPSPASRIPPESETFSCSGTSLPLMRLWRDGASGPLSRLRAVRPELFSDR